MATKAEIQGRADDLAELLYEAVTILRNQTQMPEEDMEDWIEDFLERCRLQGLA